MEIKPLTYKWLSALMCYPERDLIDALPEFQAALNELPELKNNPYRDDLDKLKPLQNPKKSAKFLLPRI